VDVPGFMARQFYVVGSLRNTADGFSLAARNPLGEGTLTSIRRLAVDGRDIPADAVTAIRQGDGESFRAAEISPSQPVRVGKGDQVTLRVVGTPLAPGEHRLEVELTELNLGLLRLSVSDRLSGD
jgi:hypothetical protein